MNNYLKILLVLFSLIPLPSLSETLTMDDNKYFFIPTTLNLYSQPYHHTLICDKCDKMTAFLESIWISHYCQTFGFHVIFVTFVTHIYFFSLLITKGSSIY